MLTRVESNINEFYFFDRGSFYLESVIENLRSIYFYTEKSIHRL